MKLDEPATGPGARKQPRQDTPRLRLSAYTDAIADGWPDWDVERAIVCGLPRGFHALRREAQEAALRERPPLTGTRWDALLAAMVEHLAWIHNLETPDWVDEPERFLETTWVLPKTRHHAAGRADVRAGRVPAPRRDPRPVRPRRARGRTRGMVAMSETRTFDREELTRLLDEVSEQLRHRRTRAQIYVIGGAAMSLAFSRDRRTEDIDARIDTGHSELIKAARHVARRHNLPETWLNEQATSFIPGRRDQTARTVYQSHNLTVTSASPKHLLAMKLYSARRKDERDVQRLVQELDIRKPDEAIAIYEELFPDEPLRGRALELLNDALRQPGGPEDPEDPGTAGKSLQDDPPKATASEPATGKPPDRSAARPVGRRHDRRAGAARLTRLLR